MPAHVPQPDGEIADAGRGSPRARPGGAGNRRRWVLIALGLLRAGATSLLLIALYYVLPLDRDTVRHLASVLVVGLTALTLTGYWQIRAILRSRFPGIQAIEALAMLVPFFLILFASTYFMISFQTPATFSEPLTRSDALYFTVTTFATVGFGDIAPRAELVRLLVSGQVLLDLVIVGLGIRVILGAVQKSRSG
ncbi:potassium channel family protein [Promicromonospora vindobonensis]|uniref:Potassium channel family protein n=1 Tax=Promicromonospora vindobonensis TaxID=195748 RepID=A0ABW5VPR1_9MICO